AVTKYIVGYLAAGDGSTILEGGFGNGHDLDYFFQVVYFTGERGVGRDEEGGEAGDMRGGHAGSVECGIAAADDARTDAGAGGGDVGFEAVAAVNGDGATAAEVGNGVAAGGGADGKGFVV